MSLVDGVGGAFIFSEDPKRLSDWYAEHLGIAFEGSEEFGAFYVRYVAADPNDPAWVMDTTFEGVPARITTPARTVVDCFRFRSAVGLDVALEALRAALYDRKATVGQIWRAAEACRAKSLVRPVLEALAA